MLQFIVRTASGSETAIDIELDLFAAGSVAESPLRIPDPAAAPQHFEVSARSQDVLLRDLATECGTRVNGNFVSQVCLGEGDVISVGATEIVFVRQRGRSASASSPTSVGEQIGIVPNRVRGGERSTQVDCFRIRMAYQTGRWFELGYPLVIVGGGVAYVSTGLYEFGPLAPAIILAALVWACWIVHKAWQASDYVLRVSDEWIQVGTTKVPWSDISLAEVQPAAGMKPHITLTARRKRQLVIPAAVEGIEYISAIIEKHVANIRSN